MAIENSELSWIQRFAEQLQDYAVIVYKGVPYARIGARPYGSIWPTANPSVQADCVQGCHEYALWFDPKSIIHSMN